MNVSTNKNVLKTYLKWDVNLRVCYNWCHTADLLTITSMNSRFKNDVLVIARDYILGILF